MEPTFDSEFDYAAVVTGLTAQRVTAQAEVTRIAAEIATLEAAAAYSSITTQKVASLNSMKTSWESNVANIDAVLAEIAVVQALTAEQKADLYYFYTIVLPRKADFMARTLFNHVAALADGNIAALRADTTTASESKTAVAKIIYETYSIKREYISVLLNFTQFVGIA
jgi:hypothetical protein